jgi:hypothetical protein
MEEGSVMKASWKLMLAGMVMVTLTGCGSLMHPRAGEFLEQAEINLTNMVEASIKSIQGKADYQDGLDTLHNQLYALKKSSCQVTEEQGKTVAYAKAHTLRREIGTIFHRLWKKRDDQALRDMHLELLAKRVGELREALQAAKG